MTTAQIEGQRFLRLIEDEGYNQTTIGPVLGRSQGTINKYIQGNLRIPTDLVKELHLKFKMSLNWFYLGTGRMRVSDIEKKDLVTNIADLKLELAIMTNKLESNTQLMDKMYKDFYGEKAKS